VADFIFSRERAKTPSMSRVSISNLTRTVQIIGRCHLMCCEAAESGRASEGPIYSAAMSPLLLPLQMLLLMFAGWVNRRQLDVIEYLQEENRVLKERMGGRRLRFTDAERRRLARKAQALGRKVLNELETLVTPDTLLRWYRELVAFKWNYSQRRGPGQTAHHEDDRRTHSSDGA
jgi:hypothetical protein